VLKLHLISMSMLLALVSTSIPTYPADTFGDFPDYHYTETPVLLLGRFTTTAYLAAEKSAAELSRRGLRVSDYRRISVHETPSAYVILFSNIELDDVSTGSSGPPGALTVRLSKPDLKLLGSRQENPG
jgi:hypothetical protein